ncbi:hypothetical protein JTB14_014858 [Gonioctena quinquepunctata]|nr:hypothetical protein JTB14_014858 [Gonioctena quinquepunctata]
MSSCIFIQDSRLSVGTQCFTVVRGCGGTGYIKTMNIVHEPYGGALKLPALCRGRVDSSEESVTRVACVSQACHSKADGTGALKRLDGMAGGN